MVLVFPGGVSGCPAAREVHEHQIRSECIRNARLGSSRVHGRLGLESSRVHGRVGPGVLLRYCQHHPCNHLPRPYGVFFTQNAQQIMEQ